MKRLLLAIIILTVGTTVFSTLRNAAAQLRSEAAATRQAWTTHTQLLAQAHIQLTSVEERVRDLKQALEAPLPGTAQPSSNSLFALAGAKRLSAEQSERMLADLGFNWSSTGDYLVVSKQTLSAISLPGLRGRKLNDAACQVLAITPDERAGIEAITQNLGADYQAWAEAHVQRAEPSGNIVAQYTLPSDPEFSQSLSNRFTSGILAALGRERGDLLLDYASSWMRDLGMSSGSPSSLTVKRYPAGNEVRLGLELKQSGNTMSTDVSPYQPFPQTFLALFPKGWPDLAQREGFELPKGFRKK